MKEEFDALFAEHQKLLGELQAIRNVKRTWVGLTDDECEKIWLNLPYEVYHDEIRMIEQIIKDKNT